MNRLSSFPAGPWLFHVFDIVIIELHLTDST